jgi:hypothetical protein
VLRPSADGAAPLAGAALFDPRGVLAPFAEPAASGTVLVRPGEPSGAFFVLLSGSVRVTEDSDAAEGASPLGGSAGAPAATGSLVVDAPAVIGFRSFATATDPRDLVTVAGDGATLASFDLAALMDLGCDAPQEFVELLLTAVQARAVYNYF